MLKDSGEELLSSPAVPVVGPFTHRLGMMELTGHKHHRILRGINNSFSRVLSPRQ